MHYLVPMLILTLAFASFIAAGRGRLRAFPRTQAVLRVVVALPLVFSGILLHFLAPAMTAAIVPPGFPFPVALVIVTGVFELAGAVGLFIPAFRKSAALGTALLLIAIFPANIYVAGKMVEFGKSGGVRMPGVAIRLVMQVVYMGMVLVSSYGIPVRRETD